MTECYFNYCFWCGCFWCILDRKSVVITKMHTVMGPFKDVGRTDTLKNTSERALQAIVTNFDISVD